jgi:hypothetical protein
MLLTSAREPAETETLSSPNIGSDATTKFAAMHTLPDGPKRADADYTSFTGEIVSRTRRKPPDGGKSPLRQNFFGAPRNKGGRAYVES